MSAGRSKGFTLMSLQKHWPSSRTELTLKFISVDRKVSTITYVGRLVDSRKGLPVFLDAIELLLAADLPPFHVRIVGGTEAEAAGLEAELLRMETMRPAVEMGRVSVSSRFDGWALPEIYSRSDVVCLPSLREQFGMVAVEAMMCGAPVVATRTGGLQDLIVQDLNGYLVDRGNAPALAAALAQFVRNRRLGAWMGRNAELWSRERFALEAVAERYLSIYEGLLARPQSAGIPSHQPIKTPIKGAFSHDMLTAYLPTAEAVLGCKILAWTDVSSSPTPSFVITTERGGAFLKLHQERPPSLTCLVTSSLEEPAYPVAPERVKIARLLTTAAVAPRVVAADEESGLLIQEALSPEVAAGPEEAEALMLAASRQLQQAVLVHDGVGSPFLQALEAAGTTLGPAEAVKRVDEASAQLSTALLGVHPRLRKCHPQIELLRLAEAMRRDAWAFPQEFLVRARSVIRFLIAERPLIRALPSLQHGSMKREHLMRRADGSLAVCDLDHAGLYVGPHDIAHWFHDEHANQSAPAPHAMLSRVAELANGRDEAFLGAVWLAVFPIFNAQWRFARGIWQIRPWDMQFLLSFTEAFRKVFTR